MEDIGVLLIYKLTGGLMARSEFAIDLTRTLIRGLYGQSCLDEQECFSAAENEMNWTIRARNRRTQLISTVVIAKADAQVLQIDIPALFSEANEEMARWARME